MPNSTPQALEAWLLLVKAPQLGPVGIRHLLEHLESPERIISASPATLRELKTPSVAIRWLKKARAKDVAYELLWSKKKHHHVVNLFDEDYPYLLRELHAAPVLLFVNGNINLLKHPQLAIVGSRNPTHAGKQIAFEFAKYLSQCGLVINSGLAQGIDGESHKGALIKGKTIAVCATGLDRVYPNQHLKLAEKISQQGALVSEFLPGTELHKAFFPRRNRLISGLSIGTLVVEASIRSGSLITAQYALEQGREVFAIPGSIHNPMAKGCHKLIQQGAKLVEKADDILDELQSHLQHLKQALDSTSKTTVSISQKLEQSNLDSGYQDLLEVISYNPISIDELIENTNFKADQISSMLLILELEGFISNAGSGRYTRT